MARACSCDFPFGNTGIPSVSGGVAKDKKIILTALTADDGSENKLDLSTFTFTQAEIDALINQDDASKRWFVMPEIKNITDERADPISETLGDGTVLITGQGVRSFAGDVIATGPKFLKRLKEWECNKFGAYVINDCGDLKGDGSESGYLKPIKINASSWNPQLVKATDTTVQKVNVAFDWDQAAQDADICFVAAGDMEAGVNLCDEVGLLDVEGVDQTGISTTGFTITLETLYGSATNRIKVKGLVLADFSLFNITQASSVTITSVTESPDGTYAFVIPAQTSSDVLRLSITKDGFDDRLLEGDTISIP